MSDSTYIKLHPKDKSDEFRTIGERVQRGELKWAYYAIDNDKGYHYYEKLK